MTEITNYIFIGIIIGLLVVLCWQGWHMHKLKLKCDEIMNLYLLSHMQMKYDDWSETNPDEPFIFNNHKARVSNLGSSPLDYDTLKEMFKEDD